MLSDTYTRIGQVRSVNPARREVRVDAPERHLDDMLGWDWLEVALPTDEIGRYKIVGVAVHGEVGIVSLAPGVPRDTVAQLKKRPVIAPTAVLTPASGFDVDAAELTGMTVEHTDGSAVGEIVAGFKTKANGVLEVLRSDGGSMLLPLIPEAIETLDLDRGKVIVGDIAPFSVEQEPGTRLV